MKLYSFIALAFLVIQIQVITLYVFVKTQLGSVNNFEINIETLTSKQQRDNFSDVIPENFNNKVCHLLSTIDNFSYIVNVH